jgi:hypothetical protein
VPGRIERCSIRGPGTCGNGSQRDAGHEEPDGYEFAVDLRSEHGNHVDFLVDV